MRLKLRDVTFVGTVALWVEAQALCERAPSLISSPCTWIVADINTPKTACAVYSCVLNTAGSRSPRIPKIWIAARFLLICSPKWRLPRMVYNGSGGVSRGSTVTCPHPGRARSRSAQRPYHYRNAVPTLSHLAPFALG